MVNFIPKSESADERQRCDGEVTATYGSYSKRNVTGQIGMPLDLGFAVGRRACLWRDRRFLQLLSRPASQPSVAGTVRRFRRPGAWALSADYMYYHSNGDVQTPGWNRLTQALIDNGTYITGSNTSLQASPGATSLTLNNFGGNPYTFDPNFTPLYIAYPGCGTCTDAAHTLNSGFGTTWHSAAAPSMSIPGVDFSNTATHTGFAELARGFGDGGKLRLQGFVDTLENDRFVSYGFPGSYRTQIGETRLRYDFSARCFRRPSDQPERGGRVLALCPRHRQGKLQQRRDRAGPPRHQPACPAQRHYRLAFQPVAPGQQALGWENDVRSNTTDAGLFATSDIAWEHGLDLTLGGRYDDYNVRSVDLGVLPFEPASGTGRQGLADLFRQPQLQNGFRAGALYHQRQILRHRNRPGQPGDDLAAGGR